MARYKHVDYAQGQFISVAFEHQILPGSFEHALSYIVDNKLDFAILDDAHDNDELGAPAYDPRVMLKIVLYAYARGLLELRDRRGLPAERRHDGPVRQHPAALHHHRPIHP